MSAQTPKAPAPQTSLFRAISVGIPVLLLVIVGIAITGFVSANMIIEGIRERSLSRLIVGGIIAALWLAMGWKTARASAKSLGAGTPSDS